MVRRTFRFGLRAGLLAGIVIALIKTIQSRRAAHEAPAPPSAWPPVPKPASTSATPSTATPSTAKPEPVPPPTEAAEPGMERPASAPPKPSAPPAPPAAPPAPPAPAAPPAPDLTPDPSAAASPTVDLAPEPLVAAEPAGATPPGSPAAPAGPGTLTQQPAGRVRPLKATKAPAKAAKKTAKAQPAQGTHTWIAPISDDLCPQSHPVKAKLASRMFHVPGGQNYARCRPDRCYESEQAAETDGFSRSKR